MTLTSGTCVLKKDSQNLVGISIGGGASLCPCLYIVQIFDNTSAAKDGSLAAGEKEYQIGVDEIFVYLSIKVMKSSQ